MKILFVMMGKLSVGGIETVVFGLWKELTGKGHQLDFVCHGDDTGSLESYITDHGSKVYHIPSKGKDYRGTIREFTKIIKEGGYDVVHSHMNATGGIYLKIAKKYGVRALAAHSHASTTDAVKMSKLKALINEYEKFPTNKYSNIKIACSERAGKWLFKSHPFNVVMNAVDIQKFLFSRDIRDKKRNELGINDDEFVLIHIGSFLECKNHDYLIKIMSYIKNHFPTRKVKLLLAGDGPLRKVIEGEIRENDLKDYIYILGLRNDINELLQAGDVFLLPSFTEGNPVSLIEAASSGIHCIASDKVPDDIAVFFKEGNIDFISIREDALSRWSDSIFAGWERVTYTQDLLEELSVGRMASRIENLYKEILEN